jgi:CII-binding regulator of phage lambda lysogenization HflD
MGWMKWLGFEQQIQEVIAPSLVSLEQRLIRLGDSQETLKAKVAQIKALVDADLRRSSLGLAASGIQFDEVKIREGITKVMPVLEKVAPILERAVQALIEVAPVLQTIGQRLEQLENRLQLLTQAHDELVQAVADLTRRIS